MLSFAGSLKVFLAVEPCDMRKGFEGLTALVAERLRENLRGGGTLFVFTNKSRTRLKVLYWDGSGLWICSKRLEKGRFSWPVQGDEQGRVRMSSEELTLLVSGIELSQSRRKDWYRKEIVEAGVEKPGD